MPAEIRRHEASNTNTSLSDRTSRKEGSLGAPGIVSQPETITPKSETVELGTTADKDDEPTDNKLESETIPAPMQRPTPESQPQPQSTPQPTSQPQPTPQVDTAAKEQLLLVQTIDQLQKKLELQAAEQGKLNAMLERLQSESQKRNDRADAANREALTMLEKRTAEVTELQLKLKSQQESMEKMELKSKESKDKRPEPDRVEAKKKEQNKGKGKKPDKPSGDA